MISLIGKEVLKKKVPANTVLSFWQFLEGQRNSPEVWLKAELTSTVALNDSYNNSFVHKVSKAGSRIKENGA
jgi:hypothetical protein